VSRLLGAPAVPSSAAQTAQKRSYRNLLAQMLVAAALFGSILFAWSNSFGNRFVLDSKFLILRDARVHSANMANLDLILSHPYWLTPVNSGLYRPFATMSYLFNYSILGDGEKPAGYHWLNLILHCLNAFLVYLLALRLLKRMWPAVFVAGVWALHPIVTESVTNIAGRTDLLACAGIFGALLMYAKSSECSGGRQVLWLIGLSLATTIGVFSKENAVVILGLIVLYQIVRGGGMESIGVWIRRGRCANSDHAVPAIARDGRGRADDHSVYG